MDGWANEARCDVSKQDQAARIAEKAKMLFCGSLGDQATYEAEQIEKAIRKYGDKRAKEAVSRERERFVGCIMPDRERYFLDRTIRVAPHLVCEEIIEKINAKAIRKGKA